MNKFHVNFYLSIIGEHNPPLLELETSDSIQKVAIREGKKFMKKYHGINNAWIELDASEMRFHGFLTARAKYWGAGVFGHTILDIVDLNHPVHKLSAGEITIEEFKQLTGQK